MELRLTKDEIEQILLVHVARIVPEAALNRIEWDGYRTPSGATFDHTDVPQEAGDE